MTTKDILMAVYVLNKIKPIYYSKGGGRKSSPPSDEEFALSQAYFSALKRLEDLAVLDYEYENEDEYEIYVALIEYFAAKKLAHHNPGRMIARINNGNTDFASDLMSKLGDAEEKLFNLYETFEWGSSQYKFIKKK